MSDSIPELDFCYFCNNLGISSIIKDKIESRLKTITKRINRDYWNSDSETEHRLIVGSYGRGTAIEASDIDVVIELPLSEYDRFNDYTWNGQSSFLQSVKESIKKTYPTSDVSGDGQVVDIFFSDGIKFEIVPSFKQKDGSYTYADTNNGGHWRAMKPSLEIGVFSYYDLQFKGNLRNLCRMARAWKQKNTVIIPGIFIDTLACDFLEEYKHSKESCIYYDWMSRDFFKFICELEDKKKWQRIIPGEYIEVDHVSWIKSDARKAYNLSLKAIDAMENKNISLQRDYWREIYGDQFPR